MPDILPFLKDLLTAPGLSGYEQPASNLIETRWRPLVHEISHSNVGSLHGLRRGNTPDPRPRIMIATHMDAIGLMVTGVVDGFLRIIGVGGVDARVLPGQQVTVFATGGPEPVTLPAVVAQPPARLLPPDLGDGPVPMEYLLLDTGLPAARVAKLVQVGDLASYASQPVELPEDVICGHTLDNRSSVAALTVCLEELQSQAHAWDVWAVATAQEETGLTGGYTSAYQLQPSLAIVVDVTFAKGPGASDWQTTPMGKGPTLCMGPNIHPALFAGLKDTAERLEIPYRLEYAPRHTGTDAYAAQVAAEGIPCAVIGIPLRYMHTPVELVSIKDIQRTGRLMAAFIASLAPDFMDKIVWDK